MTQLTSDINQMTQLTSDINQMTQLTSDINQQTIVTTLNHINEIKKGLTLVGLNFSDSELQELQTEQIVSLEDKSLGEIGSLFILAAAISSINSGNPRRKITFRDLPQIVDDSKCSSGIPIHFWDDESLSQKCLYLTLVEGKPAISLDCLECRINGGTMEPKCGIEQKL